MQDHNIHRNFFMIKTSEFITRNALPRYEILAWEIMKGLHSKVFSSFKEFLAVDRIFSMIINFFVKRTRNINQESIRTMLSPPREMRLCDCSTIISAKRNWKWCCNQFTILDIRPYNIIQISISSMNSLFNYYSTKNFLISQ